MDKKKKKIQTKYITPLSFALVVVIFILQTITLYNLYRSNVDLLQSELNAIVDRVYQTNLNFRLIKDAEAQKTDTKKDVTLSKPTFRTDNPISLGNIKSNKKENAITILNLSVEEIISKRFPIKLEQVDSITKREFAKRQIKFPFYSEIIDLTNNEILTNTLKTTKRPSSILISKNIPLNFSQTKALRIIIVNPINTIFYRIAIFLIIFFILSLVCIYSFYVHRKMLSEQRKLAQVKSEVFGDISHEFKKPLSVLRQVTSAFENEKVITSKERRNRYLKIANEEINKMTEQTEMILSMAMDDEGFLKLSYTNFNIQEIISILADRFIETSIKTVEIKIQNDLIDANIDADKEHFQHVISNLLSNAIKYCVNLPVMITIKLSQERKENFVTISIKDNGIGISKEDQPYIFDRYSRINNESKSKGHGIGLNYVRRIVEKHGGKVAINSELNKGSEFIIKIPKYQK